MAKNDEFKADGTGMAPPWVFRTQKINYKDYTLIQLADMEAQRVTRELASDALITASRSTAGSKKGKDYNQAYLDGLKETFAPILAEDARAQTLIDKENFDGFFDHVWKEISLDTLAEIYPDLDLKATYQDVFENTLEYASRSIAHKGLKGPAAEQRPSWWASTLLEVIHRTLLFNEGNQPAVPCCLCGNEITLDVPRYVAIALMEEGMNFWAESNPHPEIGLKERPIDWEKPIPREVLQRVETRLEDRRLATYEPYLEALDVATIEDLPREGKADKELRDDPNYQKLRKLEKDFDEQHKILRQLKGRKFTHIFKHPHEIEFDHMGRLAHLQAYTIAAQPKKPNTEDGQARADMRYEYQLKLTDEYSLNYSYRWSDIRDTLKKDAHDFALDRAHTPWKKLQKEIYDHYKPQLRLLCNMAPHVGIAHERCNQKDNKTGKDERRALGGEQLERVWQGEWERASTGLSHII